jgi:hypothetical protein
MSDIAKHLPLSQRERGDESQLSADRSAELSAVLTRLADVIERMPAPDWHAQSARPGCSMAETATVLLWRLQTPASLRRAALRKQLLRTPFRAARALELGIRASPARSPESAVAELRALAAAPGHARVPELAASVCAALDIAHPQGITLGLSPTASGAVALYQLQRAPYAVKAAARGHRLRAGDAEWSVGFGPELVSDAEAILLFLFGRAHSVPGA